MRPPRADIAAPPWPAGTEWVDRDGAAIERLTATGPVLVHFFDFAQLNSLRALPYLLGWTARYSDQGLATIGVHSPRFAFTRGPGKVAQALEALGVSHPVALDDEFRIWRDYGCQGWPSLFLWGRGGALRWYHLGEGEYADTERALQDAVGEADLESEFPDPLGPFRPSDEPGARVVAPSDEVFPGGSPDSPWPAGSGEALQLEYGAGGAYASVDGSGELAITLDGEPQAIQVPAPGLVQLSSHERHEEHALRIEPPTGVEIYSISFAPGVPG
jgi:hypothetical protein